MTYLGLIVQRYLPSKLLSSSINSLSSTSNIIIIQLKPPNSTPLYPTYNTLPNPSNFTPHNTPYPTHPTLLHPFGSTPAFPLYSTHPTLSNPPHSIPFPLYLTPPSLLYLSNSTSSNIQTQIKITSANQNYKRKPK